MHRVTKAKAASPSKRRLAWLAVALLAFASGWPMAAWAAPTDGAASDALASRLDGIAAVVGALAPGPGADVVLHSDVELRARLALAAETGSGELAIGQLPEALLNASLQEIIGELLIAREARRVQIALPTTADAQREKDRLVRSVGGAVRAATLLSDLGAREEELDAIARRRVLVAAFLRVNLEGVTTVTQAELEQALSSRPEGMSLEQLREGLAKAALERAVKRWVVMLRARIPVRVYGSGQ
jgi:hypothetical protein